MAIPKEYDLTLPLLRLLENGEDHLMANLVESLGKEFNLTYDDLREKHKSGILKFENRVWFARNSLKQANLIESRKRSHISITAIGQKVLENPQEKLTYQTLLSFPQYKEYINKPKNKREGGQKKIEKIKISESESSPQEMIDVAYQMIETELKENLLEQILNLTPEKFEYFVLELLKSMDYGVEQKHLGQTGDHGVDGVINQDYLGLDRIYVQAKRYQYDSSIGASEIRNLAGGLGRQRANKGLFITTSYFTSSAKDEAERSDKHIILIDGEKLTDLMVKYNVGCRVKPIQIRELDEDFFETL